MQPLVLLTQAGVAVVVVTLVRMQHQQLAAAVS
jgi:hypothetical protein